MHLLEGDTADPSSSRPEQSGPRFWQRLTTGLQGSSSRGCVGPVLLLDRQVTRAAGNSLLEEFALGRL